MIGSRAAQPCHTRFRPPQHHVFPLLLHRTSSECMVRRLTCSEVLVSASQWFLELLEGRVSDRYATWRMSPFGVVGEGTPEAVCVRPVEVPCIVYVVLHTLGLDVF